MVGLPITLDNQNTWPGVVSNHTSMIETLIPSMIPGDFAEFGCYNGGHVARLAALDGRPTWAFDTFEGIPGEEYNSELDYDNPPGKFTPTHDVLGFLSLFPNIKVQKGRFCNTLPNIQADTVFAMVYLDCDYYESYKQVLEYLEAHNHIKPGTFIVMDDYKYCAGAKKAVDEWRGDMKVERLDTLIVYGR